MYIVINKIKFFRRNKSEATNRLNLINMNMMEEINGQFFETKPRFLDFFFFKIDNSLQSRVFIEHLNVLKMVPMILKKACVSNTLRLRIY